MNLSWEHRSYLWGKFFSVKIIHCNLILKTSREHRKYQHKAQMYTVAQLNTDYNFIDWKVFFKNIFNDMDFPEETDQFIINSPQYLKKITLMMNQINNEEKFKVIKGRIKKSLEFSII